MSDTSTTIKQKRIPALEYCWFDTLIEEVDVNGDNQKASLKDYEGLKIGNVDLDKILDLGFAYAALPFINWLGFSSKIVSTRLTSAVKIEISFTHGTTIISGEIAANKMTDGDVFTSKAYYPTKFSIGFPGKLTATKGEGIKKTPLYPTKNRSTNEDSNNSKGISKILFKAWCLHLPLKIYDGIGDIRMVTHSKSKKISGKFDINLLRNAIDNQPH